MSIAVKVLLLLSCLVCASSASNEVLNLLLQQNDLQLSTSEIDALRPFFLELQTQYDYLYSLELQKADGSGQAQPVPQIDEDYEHAFDEFRAQFANYLSYEPTSKYDTSLPSMEELLGQPTEGMTHEQQLEFEDMQSILQDVLDEAQEGIDELVKRAIDLEEILLNLNKPRIVMAAINGLGFMNKYWGRATIAAYCSYSHVPQMTEALHAVNGGVECYSHTMALILRIQDETVASVKELKKNVFDIVGVYKKIAAKNTITGKILSATLNVLRLLRRVHDIIAVGIDGYGKITKELPGAALKTAQCGVDFVKSVPQMIETAQNLTSCIIRVDNNKPYYDFIKPEEDRYWNTGETPSEIPHENEGQDDDDDDYVDADEDYVDHR